MYHQKTFLAFHLILAMAFCLGGVINAEEPRTVSTFNCIGIYWSPEEGSTDNPCSVSYRRVGDSPWKEALPLWFDDRDSEYRGSIVNLEPETLYQIKLDLTASRTTNIIQAATWTEDIPVLTTNYLPASTTSKVDITQSGSPNGYILYTPYEGSNAVVDVNNHSEYCIGVNASNIIIRNLIIVGGLRHGIKLLADARDVIIEGCTISNWGMTVSDGGARYLDSAVYSQDAANMARIVIQRNELANPRYGANSWDEYREYYGSTHPAGPNGVCFWNNEAGNHVIRYNTIYGSLGHEFNDGIGGSPNFSLTAGCPPRDTDIYGNTISDAHDDAIESEGINNNNRIWGNYLDKFLMAIGCASVSQGPLYIWRNVCGTSRINETNWSGGMLVKAGGEYINGVYYGGGRTYVLHNTCLHTSGGYGFGVGGGIHDGNARYLENTVTRNNIFEMKMTNKYAIANYNPPDPYDNDFDYDLYLGVFLNVPADQELHGIYGDPVYSPTNAPYQYYLKTNTVGHNAGCVVHNINDDYQGSAPDMGAFEIGRPPVEFGVNAYTNSSTAVAHVDDFESGHDGWDNSPGITESRDNQTARYFNYSLKLSGVNTNEAAYAAHARVHVDGARAYKLSMWLYVEAVSAGAPRIRVKQYDAQGAPVAYNYSLGYDTNKLATWQLITLNFDTEPTAGEILYTLDKGVSGSAALTAAFMDRVKLLQLGVGPATQVRVETAADGGGTVAGAQDLASGSALTVYAISRDAQTNFLANVAADAWALIDTTGGVVPGDLATNANRRSATLTGAATGTAKIEASSGALAKTASGIITVKAAQAITDFTPADGLSFAQTSTVELAAQASSGLTVEFAVVSGPGKLAGASLSFTNTGMVSIKASQAGDANYCAAPSLTNTYAVTNVSATITLGNLTQVYDGTPKTVTSTTLPAELKVDVTYDGHVWAPSNAGSYAVVATINDAIYRGSTNGTLLITKANQTITFPAIPDQVVTSLVTLSATAGSGLPVAFEVFSGPAVISQGTAILRFTGTGFVVIKATQAGDTNWSAAADVTNNIRVNAVAGNHIDDYDGDGKSDLAVYADGYWYIYSLANGSILLDGKWGGPGWIPVAGDYDGDGVSDLAAYGDGYWYIYSLVNGSILLNGKWGGPGWIPVPGDYDGDGKSDLAVYANGYWNIYSLVNGSILLNGKWGGPGWIPVPGDYDGDSKSDLAVYGDGYWYIYSLVNGSILLGGKWGGPGWIPVSGDYDGDGKFDLAVYGAGYWYIYSLVNGSILLNGKWGSPGWSPVPGDYDGDGISDLAVYANGYWYICSLVNGNILLNGKWGGPGWSPVQ